MYHRIVFPGPGAIGWFFCCFILSHSLLAGSERIAENPSSRVVFLHFNDFYDIEGRYGKGGLLSLSRMIAHQKQHYPQAIITFGGDLLSPSLYSSVSKGEHMIEALALLKVDIAVPGNHEFDFGLDNANRQFQASKFPWVISNLNSTDQAIQNSLVKSTVQTYVREVKGLKIGFLGLITRELTFLSGMQEEVNVSPFIDTARKMVALLKKQQVDLIVALTHLTLEEDKQLVHQVQDINLVLGGHDHYPLDLLLNNTLILKAGNNGEFLGVIKVDVDRSGKKPPVIVSWQQLSTVLSHSLSLIGNQPDQPENKQLASYLEHYQQKLNKEKKKYLAVPLVQLDARTVIVRSRESSFGNLVTDALRQHYKTDLALINGGAIRSDKIYPAGISLSNKDILSALPFANRAVVVKLSGQQLLEILEHGVSEVEHYSGRFPQISGMHFYFSPAMSPGQRISNVMIADEPLIPDKNYTMATLDFLFQGGDGYEQFNQTETILRSELGELLSNIVADYLFTLKQIRSVTMGRIQVRKKGHQVID